MNPGVTSATVGGRGSVVGNPVVTAPDRVVGRGLAVVTGTETGSRKNID